MNIYVIIIVIAHTSILIILLGTKQNGLPRFIDLIIIIIIVCSYIAHFRTAQALSKLFTDIYYMYFDMVSRFP